MDPDLSLVIGILLAGLAIPGVLAALVDRRVPKLPVVMAAGGAYLIYRAVTTLPGGFSWPDVPNAFIDVIARVIT
ncbi:hypothetical protein [Marinibacterium profundimaris]|uniref:50S ribosomal protein L35 n=1 Tax=Marinibacterium profundimaris TaxID=1679460 RepID=A0A225NE45_9RHOB|nr:hypothetical protein [Marinibacterium profundimaris]OWU70020.1 hypothetical protein ATO3_21350 [Marinibacterium profundimaris]